MKLSESLDVRDISWSGVDNRREHVLLQLNSWEIVASVYYLPLDQFNFVTYESQIANDKSKSSLKSSLLNSVKTLTGFAGHNV